MAASEGVFGSWVIFPMWLVAWITNLLFARKENARVVKCDPAKQPVASTLNLGRSKEAIHLISSTAASPDVFFRNIARCRADGTVRWWAPLPRVSLFPVEGDSYLKMEWYD